MELRERLEQRHAIRRGSRVGEYRSDLTGLRAASQDLASRDSKQLRPERSGFRRQVAARKSRRQRRAQDALGIGLVLEDEVREGADGLAVLSEQQLEG